MQSLTSNIDSLTYKLTLMVYKTVNDGLTNRVTLVERHLLASQQHSRTEFLDSVNVYSSVDNHDLKATVSNLL